MMYLLLDIDGVLEITPSWKPTVDLDDGFPDFNPIAVQSLNKILNHTKGRIVLTTSHRLRFSNDKWVSIFKKRGVNIDVIYRLADNQNNLSRKEEILNWVHENPDVENYVIIDDDKTLNDDLSNFVMTFPLIGLTEVEADNVIRIFDSNKNKNDYKRTI